MVLFFRLLTISVEDDKPDTYLPKDSDPGYISFPLNQNRIHHIVII